MLEVEMSGGVRPRAMLNMKDVAHRFWRIGFRKEGATVVGVGRRARHGPRGPGKHRCDREHADQGRSMWVQDGHVSPLTLTIFVGNPMPDHPLAKSQTSFALSTMITAAVSAASTVSQRGATNGPI